MIFDKRVKAIQQKKYSLLNNGAGQIGQYYAKKNNPYIHNLHSFRKISKMGHKDTDKAKL